VHGSELRDDIASLTQIFGASGHEDLVIADFVARVRKGGFSPAVDPLGNVIVRARTAEPGWPTVAMAAHLDEVSVAVHEVGSGWVRVSNMGGMHEKVLPGHVLQFMSDKGDLIEGHVSVSSAHLETPDEKLSATGQDLCVEMLMSSAAEIERAGIGPGTPGVYLGEFVQQGDLIRSKALDDRAGLAVLLAVLRSLAEVPKGAGLTVIATVQEEFTTLAGTVAAQSAAPDLLLCVDIAPTPRVDSEAGRPPGSGPVLQRYSKGRSGGGLIPNPRLAAFVTKVASAHDIPLSHGTIDGGYTDATYMQLAAGGISALDLAFPVRNAHTAVEVAHLGDLQRLAELLCRVMADLPRDQVLSRRVSV
jgi:putative aminopeptidase FrvX